MNLRHYQTTSLNMLRQSLGRGKRSPCLVVSTGSGKTRTTAAICKSAISKGKRVLFITPRRGLTLQAEAAFRDLGIESGVIMAGVEHDSRHMVEVASMDTITARIGKLSNALLGVQSADIIVVDEAHLSVSRKRREFLLSILGGEYGKGKRIIGLTATPCVTGGGGLGAVYDDLVQPISMIDLIQQGYLVQPRYFAAPADLRDVAITAGEYKQDDLGKAFRPIAGDVIRNWMRIACGTSTVVFTPTRANAAYLVGEFNGAGITSEYLDAHTSDSDRAAIYRRIKTGQTTVVCNVGIVSMGVDIPEIQTVVMATATKSIAKWMQACGRALRPADGKDCAYIIDHGGMSVDMGPVENIDDWSLAPGKIQDRLLERKKKNAEPKEIICDECAYVFSGRRDCPQCGHTMKQRSEKIDFYEAELREVKANNKNMTAEEKANFYGGLKYYARQKGYADGWAAHSYRKKFGVWPNKYSRARPVPPNDSVRGFIKHLMIKYAKEQAA